MDDSKGVLDTALRVTTGPAPKKHSMCMVTGQTTDLQGKMPETGDGPNHVPNPEYFLPLGSSTKDLGSRVHRVLDGILLDSLSRQGQRGNPEESS